MYNDFRSSNRSLQRRYFSDEDDEDSTSAPSIGRFLWNSIQGSTEGNDIVNNIYNSVLGANNSSTNTNNAVDDLEVEMKPFLPRTKSTTGALSSENNDDKFNANNIHKNNIEFSDTQPHTSRENVRGYEIRIRESKTFSSKLEKDYKISRRKRRSRKKLEEINRKMMTSLSNSNVNMTINNHLDYINKNQFSPFPMKNIVDYGRTFVVPASISYDADTADDTEDNNKSHTDDSAEKHVSTSSTRRRKKYNFDSIFKNTATSPTNNANSVTKRTPPQKNTNFWFLPNNKNADFIPPTIPEFDGEDDEDVDQHNHVVFEDLIIDPVVEVMDRLEDEIDGHTYDNFVPLPIKLALEEQVFGWSHLFSAFVGHITFTCLAYLATYHILNIMCLHKVPIRPTQLPSSVAATLNSDESYSYYSNNLKRGYDRHSSQYQQNSGQICFNSIRCFVHDMYQWAFIHDNDDHNSNMTTAGNLPTTHSYIDSQTDNASHIVDKSNNFEQQWEYVPRWNIISQNNFYILRLIISIVMAISAFRTVRRRRQVWLRSSYGTEEYYRDADHRRSRVEQTDKQTVLGKLRHSFLEKRNRWLSERVQRKLKKAERRFQQRRFQFQQLQQREEGYETDIKTHTEYDDNSLIMSQQTLPDHDYWSESETSSVTSHTTNNNTVNNSSLKRLLDDEYARHTIKLDYEFEDDNGDADDCDFGESDEISISSSSMTIISNNIAGKSGQQKSSPTSKLLMSITRDQVRFSSGPIETIPYAHGGFFGAAPFMLANPHWIDILRQLMPDVYVELSHRVMHTHVSKLILWAENNPVVAAYGTAHEILNHSSHFSSQPKRKSIKNKVKRLKTISTTLEWDVFLDPHLVHRLETALKQREILENFLSKERSDFSKQKDSLPTEIITSQSTENSKEIEMDKIEAMSRLQACQSEIQKRSRLLVEKMLIAHGNLNQLALEQCGFFKQYNFSRVKRTRRTLGGGIFATNWCAIYAEALKLGLQKHHQGFKRKSHRDTSSHDSMSHAKEKNIPKPSIENNINGDSSSQSSIDDSDTDYDSDNTISCQSMSSIDSSNINDKSVSMDQHNLRNLTFEQKDKHHRTESLSRSYDQKIEKGTNLSIKSLPLKREMSRSLSSTSLNELALNTCPTWSISESISLIKDIMKKYHKDHDDNIGNDYVPLSLLLDLKSRHVPKRVLALVIDTLKESGIQVDGIASFMIDEIRDISQFCSAQVNEIYFFHSAGEIQTACHDGLLRNCNCYFNAGNLFWEKPENFREWIRLGSKVFESAMTLEPYDTDQAKKSYKFQSFSRIRKNSKNHESQSHNDNSINSSNINMNSHHTNVIIDYEKDFDSDGDNCSTIEDYMEHYNLSIGLYVQEFAIDSTAISLITQYVNENSHVYKLGLSWGGINGQTVGGIQPGRVTNTDGFWNQRYAGIRWKSFIHPGNTSTPNI